LKIAKLQEFERPTDMDFNAVWVPNACYGFAVLTASLWLMVEILAIAVNELDRPPARSCCFLHILWWGWG
jgi:hypothetical protein